MDHQAKLTKTNIDEDGGLTLLVGSDEHKIVVSSKVLTVASKVFKEMLFERFKEGRELAER
jgi:hypothetical protein